MPGRKVLSHLHVVTCRRTRSTQRLIFTGLASGGLITPERTYNTLVVQTEDLRPVAGGGVYGGGGLARVQVQAWPRDELSARRSVRGVGF